MSKRTGAVPEETKERILASARREFADRGFQGASLRNICAGAGVTTGALYFFFDHKDDLFEQVIRQVTVPFEQLMKEHYSVEKAAERRDTKEGMEADFEISRQLIDLYFSNRQTWDILTHQINHPVVQTFLDRFIAYSTEHYQELIARAPMAPTADLFAIHQFVHMQVDSMLTLISHDFQREDMIRHAQTVIRMLRGAFQAMIAEQ